MTDLTARATEDLQSRRNALASKASGDGTALSTAEWDEFYALGRELQKRSTIKPSKEDSGPAA
jgi:hypothetical protein